jgi:Cytochrome oxidase complex assembly protein 1
MNINPETGNPMPQGNWFSRNWKWVLGLGCLLPLLCCGGSAALGVFGVFNAVKDNGVYLDVAAKLGTSPQAAEVLGNNVHLDGFPMTSIQSGAGETRVELTTGVVGSKGKGKVHVRATQRNADITYEVFELTTEKGERVDLRDDKPPADEPHPADVDPSEPAPREKPMPDQPEDEG